MEIKKRVYKILKISSDVFYFEILKFVNHRKKYWLLPILLVLAIFGALIVLSQGSAVAPFIYTLFQSMSYILGISCFYHDSAIAIIKDGEILFAAQEGDILEKNMILLSY